MNFANRDTFLTLKVRNVHQHRILSPAGTQSLSPDARAHRAADHCGGGSCTSTRATWSTRTSSPRTSSSTTPRRGDLPGRIRLARPGRVSRQRRRPHGQQRRAAVESSRAALCRSGHDMPRAHGFQSTAPAIAYQCTSRRTNHNAPSHHLASPASHPPTASTDARSLHVGHAR